MSPKLGRFEAVEDEVKVFRLVRRIKDHFPPDIPKPLPRAFALTPADYQEGEARQHPPMLSIWDTNRTSIEQAIAIRARLSNSPPDTTQQALGWNVGTLVGFGLDVVSDPLDPALAGAGAEGHCGIQGLCERTKSKQEVKVLRSKMADTCLPV